MSTRLLLIGPAFYGLWQGFDVHLQPDGQGRRRIDFRDDLVHPQRVGPQLLIAKGVEPKDGLTIPVSQFTEPGRGGLLFRLRRGHQPRQREGDRGDEHE